ncbi:uncharacterized protein LOC130749065 isoform X2 [Lotus japonicus]|uniref:uncharacterized protein LOC130749065 isoform X2 n=1 Tax=Lotus japonicus TaxID=34305 RepID=UPI00258DB077|nr:uncharacterized protein LOC130749065 isoform X2 [Lotus japonicus]
MLLQIHMNSFLPVASFPHKLEISCFWFNNKLTRSETGTNYHCCNCCYSDKRRTRLRWRWRWRCHSGIGEWELQEGRMAVSTYLQEMGVSEDESLSIASNAPAYLNMLVEGVRDLEQLSSSSMSIWDDNNCATTATATATGFNFRDKLVHIAANKGDNGKLAYLESLGFTLYSSMNVARYLSPDIDTLPSLIHKVSSLKQLLFHSQSPDFLIRNIRRMMRPLSISIDEDLQRTLSFFEKLEARRGGLSVLTSRDSAFCYLIESFPRILSLSVDNHLTRIVDFLHNIGIPRNLIPNIILGFPPILLWNLQLLKTRVLALKEIDVVDKDYAKLVLKYPWVLSTSIQENYKEVLTFLYSVKVAKTWIDHVIKSQPHILGCSTSKLQLMVDQFAELGVQSKKLDQVIAKSPQLLLQKPRDFLQVVLFFEHMGLDKETIGRILARCPEIFATSIGKTLQRKIEFLKEDNVLDEVRTFREGDCTYGTYIFSSTWVQYRGGSETQNRFPGELNGEACKRCGGLP